MLMRKYNKNHGKLWKPMSYPGKIVKVKLLSQIKFGWGFHQMRQTILYTISRRITSVSLMRALIKSQKTHHNYNVKLCLGLIAVYQAFWIYNKTKFNISFLINHMVYVWNPWRPTISHHSTSPLSMMFTKTFQLLHH